MHERSRDERRPGGAPGGKRRGVGLASLLVGAVGLCATPGAAQSTERVSVSTGGAGANDGSLAPAISSDGRYVAYASQADNLVSGDTNGAWDVFVHDRQTGTTTRVSLGVGGAQGNDGSASPVLTPDGRYLAFCSEATNLVAGDTNGMYDVFVRDLQTGQIERVSIATDGTQADYICWNPGISDDGRYVVFDSESDTLVLNDTNGVDDVFLHDRVAGTTTRVSVSSSGAQASGAEPSISGDSRYVAFESSSDSLVTGDTNGDTDVFTHDCQTGQTTRVSLATGGGEANDDSEYPAISRDGRYVAFGSEATNLVTGDTNGASTCSFTTVRPARRRE